MRRCVVLLAVVGACRQPPPTAASTEVGLGSGMTCVAVDGFAPSVPVPEASGAAWWTLDGKPVLVVQGDSGNDGAYAIIDPDTGAALETGKLPLGPADARGYKGDDVEGLASRGDRLYGLTSSGWLRVWQRAGNGFELRDGPYPIAPVGHGFATALTESNAGKNYEGLALTTTPSEGCVGVACAKDDGHAYCLIEQAGKLAVDPTRGVAIEKKNALADCAFAPDGTLYAADNIFGLSAVYRVDHWADPARATVTEIGELGVGFPEGIAVKDNVIWRMSDTGGAPSMMAKFRCTPPGR